MESQKEPSSNPLVVITQEPWYKKGLRFGCTRCGKCCTGSPGYVWVSDEEIVAIAEFLQLPLQEFADRYLRLVDNNFALQENPSNFDCVFLENNQCQVYSVRPKQCQTFPWWPKNLESEESWHEAASRCEGIKEDAPLVFFEQIQEQLEKS